MLVLLPAQPVAGRDLLGTLRRAASHAPTAAAKLAVLAQAPGEADLGEGDAEALEQLAQGAQPLELARPVEAVARAERGGTTRPARSM